MTNIITIKILDEKLFKNIKHHAVAKGMTMQAVIVDILKENIPNYEAQG